MNNRLIIFGDLKYFLTRILFEALVIALDQAPEVELVGICHVPENSPVPSIREQRLQHFARKLFNPRAPAPPIGLAWAGWQRYANRYGARIIMPRDGDVHDPATLAELAALRPGLALSLFCLTVFRQSFLDLFDVAVNYHNGALPAYRGGYTTCWSLYDREATSGWSFHHMQTAVDAGNVLVEGVVPTAGKTLGEVERGKITAARAAMPDVVRAMRDREQGRPQRSEGKLYTFRMRDEMVNVGDPSTYTREELLRRQNCFNRLNLEVGGRALPVTELADGRSLFAPSFTTADGRDMHTARLRFLPWPVYRAANTIGLA